MSISYNPPRYLLRRFEILRHLKPGQRFIEIAAGNLKLSRDLLRYFQRGTALDYSQFIEAIYHQLPQAERERLQLVVGDLFEAKLDADYDCVVACEVMEHVQDDAAFLQKLRSLLSPSGQLILSVPSRMKYWSVHDEIVGHLRRYEKDQLIQLLKNNGFSHIEVLSYGFPFINVLRWLRVLLAKKQEARKRQWTQRQQNEDSGVHHASQGFDFLGLFVNRFSLAIPAWVASWFTALDLSDGYIVIATKSA